MKALTVNTYDISGGAARAAYRIHRALIENGVESTMCVNHARAGDFTVAGPKNYYENAIHTLRHVSGALLAKAQQSQNVSLYSTAFLPSSWPQKINQSNVDVVNLHWINHEMLSIKDISKIKKPIVWTLHDMWAFCGAEHYTDDFRWRDGYSKSNRPKNDKGLDLNKWVWERKLKAWDKPLHIVTPSNWLADCAKQSVIMKDWPIHVIPNAIDTNLWRPLDKAMSRDILNLPTDKKLVMFGAIGGTADPRKGFDLLKESISLLSVEFKNIELVIVGQLAPKNHHHLGLPTHYTGHLSDDITLLLYYSACDCFVIPSRQDNLPNTGVESLACGTPVIGFNTCGIPSIVEHKVNGYLSAAFDAKDLANGIKWVLEDELRYKTLAENARQFAVERFSYSAVSKLYKDVYASAIKSYGEAS